MNHDADILIVGLGPVGAVLAGLCARHNLSVIAIDRSDAPYALPRAATFDDEAMRVFQFLGVAPEIESICRVPAKLEFVTAGGEVLMDFPVADAPTISGWRKNYLLHQPSIEQALRRRIKSLGVDIRLGTRFESLSQDAAGVTAHLSNHLGKSSIKSKYLIGCDGASSPIRAAIGSSLENYDFEEPWLVVDLLCDQPEALPDRVMQICDPSRPTTYLKMAGSRYRWEFMMLPGETDAQLTDPAFIKSLLAAWTNPDHLTIERAAVYRFHALVAQSWRNQNVFLAGDSAHQMPPFAGQGMCAGIRDAQNLAWKLAAVITAQAGAQLLDSYQTEREPHIRHIIETVIAMGNIICLTNPEAAAARDAGMLAGRAAGAQPVSMEWPNLHGGCFTTTPAAGALFPQIFANNIGMDDAFGPAWWFIGESLPENLPAPITPIRLDSAIAAPYAQPLRAWLTEHQTESVLVRPDRFIFGAGPPAALLQQWQTLTANPQ